MKNILSWIQTWFLSQCNEVWEHSYGIKIDTLDNPGWSVSIDLIGTCLENKIADTISYNRTEDDWVNCSISDNQFKGFGGPENLSEILSIFKTCVEGDNLLSG